MVWNSSNTRQSSPSFALQIISQNYVVWNIWLPNASFIAEISCKLYHKTTWFETKQSLMFVGLSLGCKLYHKTTWFETFQARALYCKQAPLQIISQNYVVWNDNIALPETLSKWLQIISQNYVVWNFSTSPDALSIAVVANYITKLRGLKRQC